MHATKTDICGLLQSHTQDTKTDVCGVVQSHMHATKTDVSGVVLFHMYATKTNFMWFGDVSHACHQNQCMQFGDKVMYLIWCCLGTTSSIFKTH
jgi:hypothetical protein